MSYLITSYIDSEPNFRYDIIYPFYFPSDTESYSEKKRRIKSKRVMHKMKYICGEEKEVLEKQINQEHYILYYYYYYYYYF